MSASPPPKDSDVGQGAHSSPDDPDVQMDPQDPHASGLSYEFEVKGTYPLTHREKGCCKNSLLIFALEQDRWLPIANG
jgi:nuclear transcription Y subunit beta